MSQFRLFAKPSILKLRSKNEIVNSDIDQPNPPPFDEASMDRSYMGKVLWVNLSTGVLSTEHIPDNIYNRFLSGIGLASWLLYHRIPGRADPLGPDNVLGFESG